MAIVELDDDLNEASKELQDSEENDSVDSIE
jgi:hypothetical protein